MLYLMWSRPRPHVLALFGAAALVVGARAISRGAPLGGRPPRGAGSGSGLGPAPVDEPSDEPAEVTAEAGGSGVPVGPALQETTTVPPFRPSPPRFAVAKFDNQSGARAYDWLVAEAPFEISEKTEALLGLQPTGGALHVTEEGVEPEPDPVVAFAAKRGAVRYVITGWADRPNWQLRVGIALWSVTGPSAVVVAETQRTGDPKDYHRLLGELTAEAWTKAGFAVDEARLAGFTKALASDPYALALMGRGLGHLTGALAPFSTKLAEADLEKSVFVDPKNYAAQRLVGELYLVELATDPKADPKLAGKAAGKFNYATDLAPDDIASLRGAAAASTRAEKHDLARDQWSKLVAKQPWDLDARYNLGAELWALGDATGAERQLDQVTAQQPSFLAARRVLVLVHAARGDTSRLVTELEAIEQRAPTDLAVKGDLATAYGATGNWAKASAELEQLVAAKPVDMPLQIRLGDVRRQLKDTDGALGWYARAAHLAPESSLPGFAAAQTLFDAGRLPDAQRAYTLLQKYKDELPEAEQALGVIALRTGHPDEAAWYLRRAVRGEPREQVAWHALVAAELARKDAAAAITACEHGLEAWPRDGVLLYLAGVAHSMAGDAEAARESLQRAVAVAPDLVLARTALVTLGTGAPLTSTFVPELQRPWGDAVMIDEAIARFTATSAAMATVRLTYQHGVLAILGDLGRGPDAPVKVPAPKRCPVVRIAPLWGAAQADLKSYQQLGQVLETEARFIARHDDAGMTAALLPGARARAIASRASFRTALADVSELRAEWTRSLVPELRAVGCDDRLLAAALADPERYRVADEDHPTEVPEQQAMRPKARATFYVDNTRCADTVEVWIDGSRIGSVPPGRRSALTADGGERAMCLIGPSSPQCGERGTVRQVYLHDGWSTTLYCPKEAPQ